jgi:sulfite reductase beta subunit-like hemoprotein
MKKDFAPNFETPEADFNKEERNKINHDFNKTQQEFHDAGKDDLSWETEQIAKSYGIYLEFDRAKTGTEKDWMYMLRVTVPGGGPVSADAWKIFDEISEKYSTLPAGGMPSLRLTTRQNLQFHWIKKKDVVEVVKRIAESTLSTLNGCGDNTRNVMACPLSRFSDIFDANAWAKKIGNHFQLPAEPFIQLFEIDRTYLRTTDNEPKFKYGKGLLNRKFKIAVTAVHRDPVTGKLVADNCVESRTNDVGIAPVFEGEKLNGFQIFIGGGQGEKNGKPTLAALAKPFAFVAESELLPALDAIVKVHQEYGDRQNRHWARLKYVIKAMGIDWYREQVQNILSFQLQAPIADHDPGARHLHYGWWQQKTNATDGKDGTSGTDGTIKSNSSDGLWTFGAFVENGRIHDSDSNGRLKSAIPELLRKYHAELTFTPNQDILFNNIRTEDKGNFSRDLESFGYGKRNGKDYSALRLLSGACVGRDTCRLAYTDSEKFEPYLIDELENLGWGHIATSIGITGCERQCYRPATKAIGVVGSGLNIYQFKLMGTEDGRHQGQPVFTEDGTQAYLRAVPRERVSEVIDALFRNYVDNRLSDDEELGYFHRRVGLSAIVEFLKHDSKTSDLMTKEFDAENIMSA